MKITLYIPKDRKNVRDLLSQEINSASNIQDKKNRNEIIDGLNKIATHYKENGIAYFWDGNKLEYFPYAGKEFKYYCGKEFIIEPMIASLHKKNSYILITMDANDCVIGLLNGKSIKTLWKKKSYVARKQDAGGQSEKRFEQNRELQLKAWFKEIAEKLKEIYYNNYGES